MSPELAVRDVFAGFLLRTPQFNYRIVSKCRISAG